MSRELTLRKIDTAPPNLPKADDEEVPQSVIHAPQGFGRFVPPGSIHRTASRLSQSHLAHRPNRSLSQSSSVVSASSEQKPTATTASASAAQQPTASAQPPSQQQQPSQQSPPVDRSSAASSEAASVEPSSAVSAAVSLASSLAQSITPSLAESTAPSESTLRAERDLAHALSESMVSLRPMSSFRSLTIEQASNIYSPASTTTDVESSKIWATTPRAQTRQDLFSLSRPGSSLASEFAKFDSPFPANLRSGIREGDDDDMSDRFTAGSMVDEREPPWAMEFGRKPERTAEALEVALSECWTLCNTLANLSHFHRERIFTNRSGKDDKQERAWKACWKLCQTLYEKKDDTGHTANKSTLSLCRDFCQALFEVRVRTNDSTDAVLRVSFELNNHLFNTHDKSLPESFRERTLEFYVTLCHRLMKQKSKLGAETDSLLRACWTLAETLFSLRQSRRGNQKLDHDILSQAMQACWDLCDLFRAGWTQVRPDRGTPRASQTTFSQAFQTAKKAGLIEEANMFNKMTPETPTTIFDDTVAMSPDDAPMPTISIVGQGYPKSAKSAASAPAVLPRPNTTQRISRTAAYSKNRWGSINEALSEDDGISAPTSAVSQSSLATSHASLTSSLASSQVTVRTPAEDPSLTMLKALFVRAAVATGRGFSPDPRSANRDPTYTSLPLFAKSLPDGAFGPQKWQRELLENYKKTVAQDPTFKNLGAAVVTSGLGIDPEKGREDIAGILKGLIENTSGWSWLRDLFRYGYSTGVDEVLSKGKNSTIGAVSSSRNRDRGLANGVSRSNGNVNGLAGLGTSVNGIASEAKRISPPRR